MKKVFSIAIFFMIVLAVFLTLFYLTSNSRNQREVEVYASIYPLGYFAQEILGEDKVEIIIPGGIEPHDYEPSAQDIAKIAKSKLFIYNGNGLETWVDDYLETGEGKNTNIFNASEYIKSLEVQHDDERELDEDDEHENDHGDLDPHFWLDPVEILEVIDNLGMKLIEIYPDQELNIISNSNDLKRKLLMLNESYAVGLSDCKKDRIIVSHNAFGYLANRYGFEIIPITGISPESEPSAKKLSEISGLVESEGIKYIFFENLIGPDISQTIADETGASVLSLNPIESLTSEEKLHEEDYLSIMYSNLDNLKIALECQ